MRRQNGKAKDVLDDIHQEIELMSSLSHVNIVQYRGAVFSVEGGLDGTQVRFAPASGALCFV